MLIIGFVASRQTKNLGDYLLGGRRLGPTVTALSAGASDMSGWLLLGLPGALYLGGLVESWIVIGLVVGAFLNWTFVAKPLRIATEVTGSLTLPNYFAARFQDKTRLLRLISAGIVLLFFTFYAASGMVAGAILLESSFGLPYLTALLTGACIIVAYTTIGGFLAVSWTDCVQGTLMLLALVLLPIMMVMEMGGIDATLSRIDASHLAMVETVSVIGILSLLAWGLGYFGQPHILVRFMAIGSADRVDRARTIGMSWMLLSSMGAVGVGLAGIAYLDAMGQPLGAKDSEHVFIAATQIIFNPWVAGVLLAGILAAVMSTIDSQLLVSSSALSEDFYKSWLRPEAGDRELMLVGRAIVILIAVIAVLIALDPESKVINLVSYAWAGLGASFGPVVLMSLYYPQTNQWGALAGMLSGAVTVVVWKGLSGGIFDVYELLPAFLISLAAIYLVSNGTGNPSPSRHR